MTSLTFPLHKLATETGIEPSRLQFLLREFADLLPDEGGLFEPAVVKTLRQIHQWFFVEHWTVAAIQRELGAARRLRVIAVTSGKGGVGKTTVAVNLALALVAHGNRVLLFDADLGMANVHVYVGITPRVTLLDVAEGRAALGQALCEGPGGLQLLCGASGVTQLANLDPRRIAWLGRELQALSANYDVLVLDTGAGISAQVLAFLALADDILTVATPNLAATLDAYGIIKAAHEAGLSAAIHLLVNQAEAGTEAESVWQRIAGCAQRFLHFIPGYLGNLRRDPAIERSGLTRQPLLLSHPESENARRFAQLAAHFSLPPAAKPALSAA
jgi:flagellar biosynthesis protein FlhG